MGDNDLDSVDSYIALNRKKFEKMLSELVEIPTVSADPTLSSSIKDGAKLAAKFLEDAGFNSKIIHTAGQPIVFGQLTQNKNYPTVLLYNHLDVQPASKDSWKTDPFKLVKKGDNYFGRGSTDDKGPALSVLMAIRFAIENKINLNFKVIWEFEEEIGSTHFEDFVKKHQAELEANSIVVSDTIWIASDKPTIPTGLRGLMTFEISLTTAAKDAHSGVVGGAARNPLGEIAQIITECYDESTGKVKIPGFYDDVRPVTKKELNGIMASGFSIEEFMKDHEIFSLRSEDKQRVLLSTMGEPTFETHGINGGYDGPGVKTIIPPKATAKLSCRLVANQDPDKVFRQIKGFIHSSHPDAVVKLEEKLPAYQVSIEGPYAKAAEIASVHAFGEKPVYVREGGSIGSVLVMDQYLRVPVMLIGLSLPKHGYHAPNEHYDWKQASGGIKMFAKYFQEIANISRQ